MFVEQNKREGVVVGREVRCARENKSEKSGRIKQRGKLLSEPIGRHHVIGFLSALMVRN